MGAEGGMQPWPLHGLECRCLVASRPTAQQSRNLLQDGWTEGHGAGVGGGYEDFQRFYFKCIN